jgi:hypothetical protein
MATESWRDGRSAAPPESLSLCSSPDVSQLFDACDRLEKVIVDSFPNGERFGPKEPLLVTWSLVMRSLKTFDALLILADLGYGPQATMLARTLIEDAVTAWWCSLQPGQTLGELLGQHEKSVASRIQTSAESANLKSLEAVPVLDDRLLRKFLAEHGVDEKVALKHWTGRSVKNMAAVVEEQMRPSEGEALHRLLDTPYLLTNLVVHNSPAALNTTMRGRMVMSRRPAIQLVHDALAIGFDALAILSLLVIRDEERPALDEQLARDRYLFIALGDTATAGRNDPCPCGSGRKYKHCHGQT